MLGFLQNIIIERQINYLTDLIKIGVKIVYTILHFF